MQPRIIAICAVVLFSIPQALLAKKQHAVRPEELSALIQSADKVIVSGLGLERRKPLYSSSSNADVAALKQALTLERSTGWFRCACMPSLAVALYSAGKKIGTFLIYPDGLTIGFEAWNSDAKIADKEKWLHWFDDRRIGEPRHAVEDEETREKKSREDEARWIAAMPASLRPLWPKFMEQTFPGKESDLGLLDRELEREFPDQQRRILSLLSWYGSGSGPWSGYPMYEDVAQQLLMEYSTADLLSAVQAQKLTVQQLEGTARLFGGWDFNQKRPNDNRLIPPALRQLLMAHCASTTDEDKQGRARRAFGPTS